VCHTCHITSNNFIEPLLRCFLKLEVRSLDPERSFVASAVAFIGNVALRFIVATATGVAAHEEQLFGIFNQLLSSLPAIGMG